MKITPITNYSFIEKSINVYSDYNKLIKDLGIDHFGTGGVEDIQLLTYCYYEGSPDDPNNYHSTIIWANVIVKNTHLNWGKDNQKNLVLYSQKPDYLIYPVSRVSEALNSNFTQFDKYEFLTENILLELQVCDNLEFNSYRKLTDVVKVLRADSDISFSELLSDQIKELDNTLK
jgi:hypothetical protein